MGEARSGDGKIKKFAYFFESPERRDHSEDLCSEGRIILK
jgi:hypothetical protein